MGFSLGFLFGFVLGGGGGGVVGWLQWSSFFVFFLVLLPFLFLFLDIEEIERVGEDRSFDKGER